MTVTDFITVAKTASVNVELKSITRRPRVEVTGQLAQIDAIEDYADSMNLVCERINDRRLVVAYFSKN